MNSEDFKSGLSRFGSGVTIITTVDSQGALHGFTASSFSSLSLKPPLVLFCLARDAGGFDVFRQNPVFGVNILSAEQSELSGRFALNEGDKFAGLTPWFGENGVPFFNDCPANLECTTREIFPGGDHMIFVGEVTGMRLGGGEPLLFHRGRYGTFHPAEE